MAKKKKRSARSRPISTPAAAKSAAGKGSIAGKPTVSGKAPAKTVARRKPARPLGRRKSGRLASFELCYAKSLQFIKWLYRHPDIPILATVALVLLIIAFSYTPTRRGDGNEYYLTMFSLSDHLTPDLRDADIQAFTDARGKIVQDSLSFKFDTVYNANLHNGYVPADSGTQYSIHFWLYSLFAVPAKWYLQLTGQDQLKALQLTNAFLMIGAAALVLLYSGFGRYKRWLFLSLVLFSPAMWYLDFSGPEIFSYAFVAGSIALFSRRRYALAVLAGAIGATQNPPLYFLVAFYLVYGLIDIYRDRQWTAHWKRLALLCAAALPAIWPMVFNYINFSTFNLIFKENAASLSVISFSRTVSLFFDLNQGLVVYIPVVFLFFVFLLARNWRSRNWRLYELLAIIVLMALLAETTVNWNSDAVGIMRYAVWMLPVIFWACIEGIRLTGSTDRIFIGIAIAAQIVIVFSFPSWFIPQSQNIRDPGGYVKNNWLAAYVLDNHPSLYNPEQEIFTERTLMTEAWHNELPVIYARPDGNVTKILTDFDSLQTLASYGDLGPGVLDRLVESHQGDTGTFYVNLAPGEMSYASQNQPLTKFSAGFDTSNVPGTMSSGGFSDFTIRVTNTSSDTWYSGGNYPVNLSYHVYTASKSLVTRDGLRAHLPHRLKPGESVDIPVTFEVPDNPGSYIVQFDMVQDNVNWFGDRGNKPAAVAVQVK